MPPANSRRIHCGFSTVRSSCAGIWLAPVPKRLSKLSTFLTSDDVERVRLRLIAAPDIHPPTLTREDWLGAAGVFLLVFLSTCPVVVPFLFLTNVGVAVRLSNLVAILMMFAVGYTLARHAGFSPWWTGLAFVALGVALVAITIALGG